MKYVQKRIWSCQILFEILVPFCLTFFFVISKSAAKEMGKQLFNMINLCVAQHRPQAISIYQPVHNTLLVVR